MNDMKNLLAPSSPAAGGKPAVGVFRLQPPRQRPDLVARPALLDALDRSFQHRLVLLFAPAGYGKTTLLTQWWERLIQRCECAAWITLDEQSRGGPEFLISIVQALGAAGVDVGELGAGPSQALDVMGPTRALNTLLFALDRIAAPIVLILDDYHFAQSPETDELLNMFIRRMNENVHVVMASRRRPALAVPALRANFQVLELSKSLAKCWGQSSAIVTWTRSMPRPRAGPSPCSWPVCGCRIMTARRRCFIPSQARSTILPTI
jgi:ATP/maltotriose-dependent transcriptional regulator MalT